MIINGPRKGGRMQNFSNFVKCYRQDGSYFSSQLTPSRGKECSIQWKSGTPDKNNNSTWTFFQPQYKNRLKNAQNLLVKGRLSLRSDIVVWHDLIKNSISSHKSNNYRPTSVQELTNYLTTNNNKFEALVYCQRTGTPDIFKELLSTGILVLRVTKHLISKRKGKTQLGDYRVLHQEPSREIKSLDIVLRHQGNLKALLKKGKGKNLGKRQRKAGAKVRLVVGAQNESVAPEQWGFIAPCPLASLRDVRNSTTTMAQIHSQAQQLLKTTPKLCKIFKKNW